MFVSRSPARHIAKGSGDRAAMASRQAAKWESCITGAATRSEPLSVVLPPTAANGWEMIQAPSMRLSL